MRKTLSVWHCLKCGESFVDVRDRKEADCPNGHRKFLARVSWERRPDAATYWMAAMYAAERAGDLTGTDRAMMNLLAVLEADLSDPLAFGG